MASICTDYAGVVLQLSHEEVSQLANTEDVVGTIVGLVGAGLGVAGVHVGLALSVIGAYIEVEKAFMVYVDRGDGVFLTCPWWDVAGALWWHVIPTTVVPLYTIESVASGLVLDVPGAVTSPVEIQQYANNGGRNQQWQLVPTDEGFVKIMSVSSAMVLDVPGATRDSARILQYRENGGMNQQWKMIPVTDGIFKIVSRSSGLVLDVPGGTHEVSQILQYTDNGGVNQHWRLNSLPVSC